MQQANKRRSLRALGVVGVLLSTQLLSACVVLPAPYYRHRGPAVVEVQPAYPSPPPPRDGRYWRR
jgi:hypothetical protein